MTPKEFIKKYEESTDEEQLKLIEDFPALASAFIEIKSLEVRVRITEIDRIGLQLSYIISKSKKQNGN